MVVNQKELAHILGITGRRVRQLREEGFFSFHENGRGYLLEKCVPEYIDFKIKAEVKQGTSLDKEKEQAEHENIKKKISELKFRKMKGELHEARDVEYFLGEMLISFKNRLLAVPNRIAMQIIGEEDINSITQILKAEIVEALKELSDYDPGKINQKDLIDIDEEEEDDGDEAEEDGEEDM